MNFQRIYRLWRREGFKVPRKTRKKHRLGHSGNSCVRRRAKHKDHVWTWNFIHDLTAAGKPLKWLAITDEYTRECPALEVDCSITSDRVLAPGTRNGGTSADDLDGDQDIVAVSWIPDTIDGIPDGPRRKLVSILWLEQQKPLRFVPRVLETGHYYHTSVDVADFDSDGDADLLIGNCIFPQSELAGQVAPHDDWFTIWENRAADTK